MIYELLYSIPAESTEDELRATHGKVAELLKTAKVDLKSHAIVGKAKLAYPIRNIRNGHFAIAIFEAETALVKKLDEMLRLSGIFLRHQIFRIPVGAKPRTLVLPREGEVVDTRMPRPTRRAPVHAPAVQPGVPIPVSAKPEMSMEELEKKLDEILTEEVK